MLFSHRRIASTKLLALALLCVFARASGQPKPKCNGLGVITRKDVLDMSPTEWTNYVAAFDGLISKKSGPTVGGIRLNLMEALSRIHLTEANKTPLLIHHYPLFVVWHRLMLWELDKTLHSVHPGTTQPYFDWSASSSNLFGSPGFGSSRYGGSGTPIPNGAFANIQSAVGSPGKRHFVARSFDHSKRVASRTTMNGLVKTTLGFNYFRRALEGYHDAFHRAIRGDMQVRYPNTHS
jgi:Common central domain of tyrosinase